ncbi:MAG: hypothetical protein JWP04_3591 [Belnapia sp.]|nr:hypothetical protein [Belnapia sp.]
MAQDEVRPLAWLGGKRPTTTAALIFHNARLSKAETEDLSLFVTPIRLQVARRRLMDDLLWTRRQAEPSPCNDN